MSIAVLSAVTGIDKGVKLLSEINISVALVLMLFVLCAGPTLLLLNTMVENFGYYLSHILGQSFYTSIYTPETRHGSSAGPYYSGLVVILGTICGHVHCAYFKR